MSGSAVVRGSGVRRVGKGGLEFNNSIANLYSIQLRTGTVVTLHRLKWHDR